MQQTTLTDNIFECSYFAGVLVVKPLAQLDRPARGGGGGGGGVTLCMLDIFSWFCCRLLKLINVKLFNSFDMPIFSWVDVWFLL